MDGHLQKMIKKYHIELIYLPIDKEGYLVKGEYDQPNIIVVKSSLSDEETEKVILHEVGHLKRDDNVNGNYKDSYVTRLGCENGANGYLIQEKVKQYVALGNDATSANYVNLAESIGVHDFSRVKYELSKYLIE